MKSKQNPFVQIFVGVATAVITSFLIWKLGIDKKEPSPPPEIRVVMPESNQAGGGEGITTQPVYTTPEKTRPRYINASVTDGLAIDQFGYGQVSESVTIDINGNVQYINLSAMNGKNSGSARFKLPEAGFYNYEIKATTTFNNHDYYGQPCTHTGYGKGQIYIEEGGVYQLMMDLNTINDPVYKIYLEEL